MALWGKKLSLRLGKAQSSSLDSENNETLHAAGFTLILYRDHKNEGTDKTVLVQAGPLLYSSVSTKSGSLAMWPICPPIRELKY